MNPLMLIKGELRRSFGGILALALVVVLVLAGAGYKLLALQAALSGTLGGTQSTSGSGASPAFWRRGRDQKYRLREGRHDD